MCCTPSLGHTPTINSVLWPAFFFSRRRPHTRSPRDWSSDVCSSDLVPPPGGGQAEEGEQAVGGEGREHHGHEHEGRDPQGKGPRSEERRGGKERRSSSGA